MTARVVLAKNQSPMRTYSTTERSTRSIGVAISTRRPALSNRLDGGRVWREEEQRQAGGQGGGAHGHADDEQPADVRLESREGVGWRRHSNFAKWTSDTSASTAASSSLSQRAFARPPNHSPKREPASTPSTAAAASGG